MLHKIIKIRGLIVIKLVMILVLTFNLIGITLNAQEIKPTIYLIPGQGADYRLFNNLKIDSAYNVRHIKYITPEKGTNLKNYAKKLSNQIDTSKQFILIGVSLGGMIATEIGDFLNPEKIIVISSAKSRNELPGRYRFQKKIPVYKIVSNRMAKIGAQILQPIVEPDRNKEKKIFKNMLKDKDPKFLRRTIGMIINWERTKYRDDIIHIHGNIDKTIPIKNVKYNYLIENGSHMITLTRGTEISQLINEIIK